MDAPTRARLLALNRDFYECHAASFSQTRDHAWPGWERAIDGHTDRDAGPLRVLDAGCGNGRLAHFLLDRVEPRSRLHYTGVDASEALVAAARERTRDASPARISFDVLDLVAAPEALPPGPFELVAVFGLLHHLPGFETRAALLEQLAARLAPAGRLAATFWRFADEPRFDARVLPWAQLDGGIDASALEAGDWLLRWGDAPDVVRYCHAADEAEIRSTVDRLCASGLRLARRFRSDGRSGSLNEYVVWDR